MLTQVRRKIVQKDIKNYSELKITDWWNVNIGSHIVKYSNFGTQRYSKNKIDKPFENQMLDLVPYYKVNNEIYNMILCSSDSFGRSHEYKDTQGITFINSSKLVGKKIEKSFLLGETEITQELYYAVMSTNPSEFKDNPKNPVERVSWYDALIFCNRLSDTFGLERYYTITKDGKIIDTIETKQEDYVVEMNEKSKGFRLPTEWEWEYAAKARTQLLYSGSNNADEVAWYKENSKVKVKVKRKVKEEGTTQPVKRKKPNAWGFYDMSGNVKEWCENKYAPDERLMKDYRVARGGSWYSSDWELCSEHRHGDSPSARRSPAGFRVCRYI